MTEDFNQLQQIISERRTIKPTTFTGNKISDYEILEVLETANWAPTHGYTEPWRFSIFTEEGLTRLGNFYAHLDQPNSEAEGFNAQRFERFKNRPMLCSHVIGIGMMPNSNPKIPEMEELCSVAMAVQNLWLALHAKGYGGYWSTGKLAFTDKMRQFFELPEGAKSLGLFYVGIPPKEQPKGRRISTIETKLNWIKK